MDILFLQRDLERPVENGSETLQRPPQLNLTSNPFSTGSPVSPSSYPGETEYEVSHDRITTECTKKKFWIKGHQGSVGVTSGDS